MKSKIYEHVMKINADEEKKLAKNTRVVRLVEQMDSREEIDPSSLGIDERILGLANQKLHDLSVKESNEIKIELTKLAEEVRHLRATSSTVTAFLEELVKFTKEE